MHAQFPCALHVSKTWHVHPATKSPPKLGTSCCAAMGGLNLAIRRSVMTTGAALRLTNEHGSKSEGLKALINTSGTATACIPWARRCLGIKEGFSLGGCHCKKDHLLSPHEEMGPGATQPTALRASDQHLCAFPRRRRWEIHPNCRRQALLPLTRRAVASRVRVIPTCGPSRRPPGAFWNHSCDC
jgi:hypothetical protein